jgi:hypothetical protein
MASAMKWGRPDPSPGLVHFLLLLLIFMLVHTKESVTGLFMKPVYFVTLIEEFFFTSIAKYIP